MRAPNRIWVGSGKRFAARLAVCAVVGLSLLPLPILAEEPVGESDLVRSGPYVGLAGSYASQQGPFEKRTDSSVGLDIRAGWRFGERFAIEGEYEWIDDLNGETGGVEIPAVLTANGKVFLSRGDLQPWALAGMGLMYARVSDSLGEVHTGSNVGAVLRFGAGLDLHLSREVALTLGTTYLLPFGSIRELGTFSFSFGTTYRF